MPSRSRKPIDISAAAQKLLGFKSLRPGQREAIQNLLEARDTLLVQPADSQKSPVYQIAGSLLDGPTLIVSPQIAQQGGQASQLDRTAPINSTSSGEDRDILDRIEHGKVEFISLAPEQLRNPEILEQLRNAGISLVVIDEAHCVSHLRQDFRHDYLELRHVLDALDHPVVLAMTSAASREIRAEIIERLGMRDPRVLIHGFDRPNISLRVDVFNEEDEKLEAVVKRVEFAEKPGIVYVATHKHAETLAKELRDRGVEAAYYHSGIKAKDREEIHDRFMKGEIPVIVTTNAFGIGAERPDIRFVYHADVSDSVEAYYQEVAHAGHDGAPAEAVLFYRPGNISAQRYKTAAGRVNSADLQAITDALASKDKSASPRELSHDTGLSQRKVINIVHKLEEVGAAEKLTSGEVQLVQKTTSAQMLEAASEQQQVLKDLKSRRLQQMQQYAEGRSCRRAFLLRYFGDDFNGPCGNCDRCEALGGIAVAR